MFLACHEERSTMRGFFVRGQSAQAGEGGGGVKKGAAVREGYSAREFLGRQGWGR